MASTPKACGSEEWALTRSRVEVMDTRSGLVTAVAALALAGCSLSGAKPPIPTPTLASAAPTEKPEAVEPRFGLQPKAATQPMDECADAAGDGGTVDIQNVTLYAGSGGGVTAFFELAKPLPKSDTAMVGVFVSSADGERSRQLGIRWVDGQTPGPFVFDFGNSRQMNLDSDKVTETASQYIAADFPASTVADLGVGWKWSTFANAAGNDTDACPGPTGAMEYQPFAGTYERVDLD